MTNEIEVFRLSPEKDKYYETATYTRKTGDYICNNERYYTTNELTYVGKFLEHKQTGMGDGAQHYGRFELNTGKVYCVQYTYEGTTCFREKKIATRF